MSQAPHSPDSADTFAAAHPLAQRLIERLRNDSSARILQIGTGSGRNLRALRAAGFIVLSVDDRAADAPEALATLGGQFSAVISTHALLHGNCTSLEEMVSAIAQSLRHGGLLYATFGSSRDARFGRGERIDNRTFSPTQGDERGVAHIYFDELELRSLLQPYFVIEALQEHDVDRIAGSWAHSQEPLSGAVHWFAIARRR